MTSVRAAVGTLIIAISTVQLANGFFGTLVSLRVSIEDFGGPMGGLILSSYFAGYTVGAVRCGRIIERIGHIRAFAAFAGIIASATAVMPVAVSAIPWILLRAGVGFGAAGLFITTESWLNAKAGPSDRGKVFSIYMVGTFAALGTGQLLIGTADILSFRPFNLITMLFAVALLMVSTTRAEQPSIEKTAHLPYGLLSRAAPLAVISCIVAGFLGGSFYALVPAWMRGEGIDQPAIALFMFITVMGGLMFQVPVGRLSDRLDRRLVLALLATGFAVLAVTIINLPHHRWIIYPAALFLGGFMSTIYPVGVAHAHDRMPAEQIVAVSGRLILLNGIGSSLGPLLGSIIMRSYDIDGLFYFMAAVAVVLAVLASYRFIRVEEAPHLPRPFDVLTPQAASLSHAYKEKPVSGGFAGK
ncbi:MAG: MFS transporter [Nitrospiraceae bacterium]|nr:MAG: MFS transporter [Nitrospiraceae bacterium]